MHLDLGLARACLYIPCARSYDDYLFLLQMDERSVARLVSDVGFKPGHALKFKDFLQRAKAEASPAKASPTPLRAGVPASATRVEAAAGAATPCKTE